MKKLIAIALSLILIFMVSCGSAEEVKEPDTVLFAGVTQTEAIEILEELNDMGVTATYSEGTIYVLAKQEQTVREHFVLQGYPLYE